VVTSERRPSGGKEDEAHALAGEPGPFDKFKSEHAKDYIRSQYYRDKVTEKLCMTPEVENLEKLVVSNLPAY
jgi:hypothetical protein